LTKDGYGFIKVDFVSYTAHRYSYIQFRGPVSKSQVVCHTCDNRCCVNPEHLWVGTQKDNLQDMSQKGRATLCRRKLTDVQIKEIRQDLRLQREIANDYGVSQQQISKIKNNLKWRFPTVTTFESAVDASSLQE